MLLFFFDIFVQMLLSKSKNLVWRCMRKPGLFIFFLISTDWKKKKSAHAFHWLLRIHFCFIRVFIHKSGELRNTRKGQEQLFSSLTLTPAHRHWEISRLPTTESSPVHPVSVRIEPNTFGLETHLPNQWATCPQWKHMCKISEKNKPNLSTK